MNNEISNKPCGCGNCEPMCTTCGRPWVVCKGECGCNKPCCNKVNFCEYGRAVPGCIRERAPECPMQAVIPSVVVESTSNLKNLADCFVHVTSINTTFYIDDKHRTMITWAGPVEYDNYDLEANTLGLRSQFLIDHANERGAYYDKTGNYETFSFGNGGSASAKKLHVYCPVVTNYMSATASSARLVFGLVIENEPITIKDNDGNDVSPADFAALGNELADYTFVIHVPYMGEVGPTEDPVIVPEQEFAVKPLYSGLTSDGGRTVEGSGYQGTFWGILQKGEDYHSAEFTVYAYRGR